MALARTCRSEIGLRIDHHHLLPPATTTTPRPCLPIAPTLVRGRIGPRPAPHPQRSNRHRLHGTVGALSSRGFLPWRLADAGPRARGNVRDGPASATLHRSRPPQLRRRQPALDPTATFGAGRPGSGLGDEAAIAPRSVGPAASRPSRTYKRPQE